jgi:hypothetical protein
MLCIQYIEHRFMVIHLGLNCLFRQGTFEFDVRRECSNLRLRRANHPPIFFFSITPDDVALPTDTVQPKTFDSV